MVSFRTRFSAPVAYAVGTAGLMSLVAASSFFLVFFLTDVALLPPTLAANALLVGKLWDTVNDPLIGVAIDQSRARIPLRRWLFLGAIPLAFSTIAIWWVPDSFSQWGRLAWVTLAYLVFDTVFTAVQLAFTALGADATSAYDARTRLMAFGAVGAVVGYIVGASGIRLAKHFFELPSTAYAVAGLGMGLLAGGGTLLAAWGLVEPKTPPTPVARPALAVWRSAWWVLTQRPFFLLVAGMGFARLGFTIVSAALPYFTKYFLGNEGLAAPLIISLMVVIAIMVPVWKRLAERWGKAKAYSVSLSIVALGLSLTWLLPRGDTRITFALILVVGVGMAGHWVLPWAMLPDVVDWDHAHTGERRIGLYLGVYGLIDKLARTLGVVSIGWVLSATDFVANTEQKTPAMLGIRSLFGPVPASLLVVALVVLWRFPIDRVAHDALRKRIDLLIAPAALDESSTFTPQPLQAASPE